METVGYEKTLRKMIALGIFEIQQVFLFRNIGAPVSKGVSQRYWFIYAVSGNGFAEASGRIFPLARGSLVTLCPGVRFCIRPKQGETITYYAVGFQVRTDNSENAKAGKPDAADADWEEGASLYQEFTGFHKIPNAARAESCLKELYGFSLSGSPGAVPEQKCAFYNLLSAFLEAGKAGLGSAAIRQRIDRAAEWICENYSGTICVEELAARCGVSKEYFIRSFKEHMGTTPGQYWIALRIAKAKELLPGKRLSVREVAELVGFKDEFYFSRLFKKSTGVNLHEYIVFKRLARAKELLSGDFNVTEAASMTGFKDYSNFLRIFKKVVGVSPGRYKKISAKTRLYD